MRYLAQRVRLIHELRQLVRSEETIDYRAQRLGIDQICRSEYLIISDVHTLTNGSGHTSQTNSKLAVQLFANCTDSTIRKVVDIIDVRIRIHQIQQVFDDEQNIALRQGSILDVILDVQLTVDPETSHFSKVITLFREKQFINDSACCIQIWWLSISKLTVDILHCFLFRIRTVLLKRIVDDGVISLVDVLFVQDNRLTAGVNNQVDVLLFHNRFTIENNFISLNGYHLTCIFIYEVFHPGFQYTSGQTTTDRPLQSRFADFYFICQIENIQDVTIRFETNGSQQSRYRQLLLSIDVSIHDIVDVRSKFYP